MATVFEMAKQYYPRLWDKSRLEALVESGRLTEREFAGITGGAGSEDEAGVPPEIGPDGEA